MYIINLNFLSTSTNSFDSNIFSFLEFKKSLPILQVLLIFKNLRSKISSGKKAKIVHEIIKMNLIIKRSHNEYIRLKNYSFFYLLGLLGWQIFRTYIPPIIIVYDLQILILTNNNDEINTQQKVKIKILVQGRLQDGCFKGQTTLPWRISKECPNMDINWN